MYDAVRRRDLSVSCVASHAVNPLSGDYSVGQRNYRRAMRDRIIRLAEMADLFGAPHICIYSFKRPLERITAIHRVDNAMFLADMSEICARRGKVLLVANAPRTLTSTCAELADLMQRCIPPSLRICWDIVSGWRSGEVPWAGEAFEPMANYVARVHTAGAKAKPDGSFGSMTIPGAGDIPHKEILKKLLKSGFDGTIAIDPHYDQFGEADQLTGVADPIVEVLRRGLAHLQDLVKELRAGA
jgi:sugar phosphate isomerase/epimerase